METINIFDSMWLQYSKNKNDEEEIELLSSLITFFLLTVFMKDPFQWGRHGADDIEAITVYNARNVLYKYARLYQKFYCKVWFDYISKISCIIEFHCVRLGLQAATNTSHLISLKDGSMEQREISYQTNKSL